MLEAVVELPDLRVEIDAGVVRTTSATGNRLFIVGSVVGRRDASGRLHTLESPHGFLGTIVDEYPASRWNQHFDGDAVLLAVARDGTLTLAGDRFFKRDVYVQKTADGLALGSDLSLLPDSPARDEYDSAALAHSMTYYGHRPPKRHTIYRAVRRLGVGDVATIRAGALDIARTPFTPVPYEEYAEDAHGRYTDAFLEYLAAAGSADGNNVLLSSGWDSSSILAGLVRVFGAKRVTAIIGRMFYSERSGNCNRFEIARATQIAEHYGVKLHMVDLDYVKDDPDWMPDVRDTFRAHNVQSMTGLNHARLAHGAARIGAGLPLFAGETSDGAHNLGFSQYVTIFHPTQAFREYSDKMASYLFGPTFVREFLEGRHEQDAVYRLFKDRSAGIEFDDAAAHGGGRMRQMLVSFFLRNGRLPLWSGRNVRMLTRDGMERYTQEMASEYFSGIEESAPETIYSWYLEFYNSFHWQGSTVCTVQKMADHFGLPGHHPYWAAGIQDFLRTMPESWGRGLDFNPTKYPLKRMMRDKFNYPMHLQTGPHSYTYDIDPTFNHSFELMHFSQFGKRAKEVLASKPYHQVLAAEWFDLPYIDGLVDAFLSGEEQRGTALNDLVSVWLLCQSGWYA
jgi:hypothetical protein